MEWKCTKALYWHQVPGYSGSLIECEESDRRKGEQVFTVGRTYTVFPMITHDGYAQISLFAIADDGIRAFRIMSNGIYVGKAEMCAKHFLQHAPEGIQYMN